MSDDRDVAYSAFFFGFGIWSFLKGFMRLRRKRLIENIPTSTIRGLALGLVELIGKAEKFKTIKSPLAGAECVYYRYLVERYQSSGRSGRWVSIASGNSSYCPFWINDGSGKIMVFPYEAELIMPVDYCFGTGMGGLMPYNLVNFMESNHISYKGFLGNAPLRFQEWYIAPEEDVYVLGSAQKIRDPLGAHKEKLFDRLDKLKGDQQKMSEVDANKDGKISEEEWDRAVAKIEQNLLEEEIKINLENNSPDVAIKRDASQVFIISDQSQKQITDGLSWEAFLGVFGGAALSLACLAYLLWRFNLTRW